MFSLSAVHMVRNYLHICSHQVKFHAFVLELEK